MAGLGRSIGNWGDMGGVGEHEALCEWVARSCEAQGLPVKVTSDRVIAQVGALVRSAAGTGRGASAAGPPAPRSETPNGLHPFDVERAGPSDSGSDHGMVKDRLDDRSLTQEVEARPLAS
jgi:hypothetical protein